MKTFDEYHDEGTTDRCWQMKSAIVQSILDAQGTNDYELPHGYIESKPIVEELSDVSSVDDEPLVRTLCFEDALGVLPCSLPHSAAIKKLKKSRIRVFFYLYNTVMLHRSI